MRLPRFTSAALAAAAIVTLAVAVRPALAGTEAPAAASPCPTNPATPKREFRSMWMASVANIDWPSKATWTAPDPQAAQKAEFLAWLDMADRLNMNAVIVQIRPTADAFWPSSVEPWSEWLTGVRGQDPGWDPLAWAIDQTHQRNIEFHAWFNPYRITMPSISGGAGGDINALAPNHPARQHPEWVKAYPATPANRTQLYYDPGVPEARQFVENAIMDAVTRYDIDAVQFDDYFYPYPFLNAGVPVPYPDDDTFAAYPAGYTDKGEWRRNNINLLIQEMGQRIHAAKPWVKFGVSPFGIWRHKANDPLGSDTPTSSTESYSANFADTRLWVRNGWLDYIAPQIYWSIGFAPADYAKLVPWWSDVVAGTNVQLYIGQADYKINANSDPNWLDPREMTDHIAFNQAYNVSGNIHYSAVQVKANKLGATDIYAAEHYTKPALVPTFGQLPGQTPHKPSLNHVGAGPDGVTLRWHDTGPVDPTSYAIYRFDGNVNADDCGFADASHLLATVRATAGRDETYLDTTAVAGQRYTYYVTALDRLWNESGRSGRRVS